MWVSCQPGLHIQGGLMHQSRPVRLARAQAVLRGCLTKEARTTCSGASDLPKASALGPAGAGTAWLAARATT